MFPHLMNPFLCLTWPYLCILLHVSVWHDRLLFHMVYLGLGSVSAVASDRRPLIQVIFTQALRRKRPDPRNPSHTHTLPCGLFLHQYYLDNMDRSRGQSAGGGRGSVKVTVKIKNKIKNSHKYCTLLKHCRIQM